MQPRLNKCKCGGEAHFLRFKWGDGALSYGVMCDRCGAHPKQSNYMTKIEAADDWNANGPARALSIDNKEKVQ